MVLSSIHYVAQACKCLTIKISTYHPMNRSLSWSIWICWNPGSEVILAWTVVLHFTCSGAAETVSRDYVPADRTLTCRSHSLTPTLLSAIKTVKCASANKQMWQDYFSFRVSHVHYTAVGKMRNCGMWKVKCGMETVERWCGTVGKMRNAKICVCRRSFVHS